jgi:protocatechuate 3,4-dioxygenase alpha subunit
VPGTTPSQTVGPFFAIGLPWPDGPSAVAERAPGAIRIHGRVLDGAGEPVPDALVETWQADPPAGEGFRGFTRCPTDAEGRWAVLTLKPGRVGDQAPHVDVSVFARGLLNRVVTRIYFADEDNAGDPVLAAIEDERDRTTLLAVPDDDRGYRFDIHLQGERETVFFAL